MRVNIVAGLLDMKRLRYAVLLIAMSGMLAIVPTRAVTAEPDTDINVRASKDGDIIEVDVALTISASQDDVRSHSRVSTNSPIQKCDRSGLSSR